MNLLSNSPYTDAASSVFHSSFQLAVQGLLCQLFNPAPKSLEHGCFHLKSYPLSLFCRQQFYFLFCLEQLVAVGPANLGRIGRPHKIGECRRMAPTNFLRRCAQHPPRVMLSTLSHPAQPSVCRYQVNPSRKFLGDSLLHPGWYSNRTTDDGLADSLQHLHRRFVYMKNFLAPCV